MDSITQATLGAAVAHAAWHKPLGRQSMLWGAALGTLPDLDILFYPFLDDIQQLYWHRGESHSIWFMVIGGIAFGALLWKTRWKDKLSPRQAMLGVFLIFATHVMIDYFTVYGTQLLAPFSRYGFGLGNMFIIDPLYSGPLILGVILASLIKSQNNFKFTIAGLALSSAYALFSIASHSYADAVFKKQLESKQIRVKDAITGATPMNTLLWRHVARTDSGLIIGYFSIIGDSPEEDIEFVQVSRNKDILKPYIDQRNVEAVDWFSKGFWLAKQNDGAVTMADLRFGEFRYSLGDPPEKWQYIFAWEITADPNTLKRKMFEIQDGRSALKRLWRRLKGDVK